MAGDALHGRIAADEDPRDARTRELAPINDARNSAPPAPVSMAAERMLMEIDRRQLHDAVRRRLAANPWGMNLWRR